MLPLLALGGVLLVAIVMSLAHGVLNRMEALDEQIEAIVAAHLLYVTPNIPNQPNALNDEQCDKLLLVCRQKAQEIRPWWVTRLYIDETVEALARPRWCGPTDKNGHSLFTNDALVVQTNW